MKQSEKFTSIDEFEILAVPTSSKNCLGVGSFGIVKLARHKLTNKKYALKIVNLKELECEAEALSIKREIKVHSQLSHPYIIKFFDSFQKDNVITMVLEYAENGNLYSTLRKRKRFSESEAFIYFYQTLKAIEFLHANDILHRDIKPENLLLDKNFGIKLCDFGWCTEDIKKIRTTFCGTYEYMSPEVVFKKPYETNIDVWSLGILLYELTIGSSPFRAKNLQEISQKFKNHKELIFPDYLSYDLKNLIVGILKMDPEKRMTIEQILSHKWVKKMYITSGYEEPNTSKGRLRQIEEKIERKQHILQNTKSINLWDVNDQTDRKFKTIPKNNMEISITKIRKPIFFENKQKNEENSTYVNKTEYNNRFRSSNNTNILNGSFFSRTTHTQDLSVFKSVDNSKKHKIFLQETEKNSGTVLKTMENLMSQINISENHFSQIKSNQKPMASKTHAQIDQNFMKKPEKKKNTRFLFEELRSIKGKKENIK